MLVLALAAGAVNAGAFTVCARFVTHVTGTASRVGLDAGQWLLMLEYALVLVAFVAGATASVVAIQGRAMRGLQPLYAVPLLVSAALLAGTALLGSAGTFGPIGGSPEEVGDFAFLSLVAFAMGLLNAGVASSTALAVRTTHMTGPASDLGVALGTAWFATGEPRRRALSLAALRGGKVLAFIFGAMAMVPLMGALGWLALCVPAAAVAVATLRSFVPSPNPTPETMEGHPVQHPEALKP